MSKKSIEILINIYIVLGIIVFVSFLFVVPLISLCSPINSQSIIRFVSKMYDAIFGRGMGLVITYLIYIVVFIVVVSIWSRNKKKLLWLILFATTWIGWLMATATATMMHSPIN